MSRTTRRLSLVLAFVAATCGGIAAAQANAPVAEASLTAFNCVISVDYPHASHHDGSTFNVEGRVDCEQTMDSLYIRLYLHKQDGGEWAGDPVSYDNATYVKGNAAGPCSAGPGQYWGEARVTAVPPAGWSPRSESGAVNGFVLALACGDPLTGGEADISTVSPHVVLGTIQFTPSA